MNYKTSRTKYARRKRNEEWRKNYNKLPKHEQKRQDSIVFIVVLIICIVIFWITDLKTLAKWMSH